MKIQTKFSMIAMAAMLMMQGCGAKQENYDRLLDPNKLITLEIWTYYNGTQKAAFDGLVTEFNETVGAEKGIVVEAYSQGPDARSLAVRVPRALALVSRGKEGRGWGNSGYICGLCRYRIQS